MTYDRKTKRERAVAVVALWWIPIVWVVILSGDAPVPWKWAITAFGGYGLLDSVATLSGKREAWGPRLRAARLAALSALVLAVVYMLAKEGWS